MSKSSLAHPWLTEPEPIKDIVGRETCDIVVLGAGIAGCTAAEAASGAGASVIVCEKFASYTAHGIDVGSVGTKVQKAKGVEIDKALAARLIYDWGQQQANYYLIRTYVEKSGRVLDRYIDMAPRYGLTVSLNDEMTARADWNKLEDKFKQFQTAHVFERTEKCSFKKSKWNVEYLIQMIIDMAKSNGAQFRFKTKAERLVMENGTVAGVIVSDGEGYKEIRARKGVIVATGGITDNREMLRCFCPAFLRADKFENAPVGSNMGDGLAMGAWAGAAISRCNPAPICHPINFTVLSPGMNSCWLTVNRDGRRFSGETGWEPMVTNARLNVPGNKAWAVWDSDYKKHLIKQEPLKAQKMLEGLDEGVAREVAEGYYIKADSLPELAEKIGVPADALEKTVRRYNGWCDIGRDEDFGVPERFLSPVRKPPFYAFKMNAWLLNVPHGLHVDQNSQVLTEDDAPIPGLFAVGNAQGDFFANSYPVTLPGSSHGRAICFGYLVGKALAEGTTIGGYDVI